MSWGMEGGGGQAGHRAATLLGVPPPFGPEIDSWGSASSAPPPPPPTQGNWNGRHSVPPVSREACTRKGRPLPHQAPTPIVIQLRTSLPHTVRRTLSRRHRTCPSSNPCTSVFGPARVGGLHLGQQPVPSLLPPGPVPVGGRIGRRPRAVRIAGAFFPYECGCHGCAHQGRLHSMPPVVGRGE